MRPLWPTLLLKIRGQTHPGRTALRSRPFPREEEFSMRNAIHPEVCSGHGRCYSLCPEVFGEDEDGSPVLASKSVPEQHQEAARAAEQNCPERAIEITE